MSVNNQLYELVCQQQQAQAGGALGGLNPALFNPTLNQVRIERDKLLGVLRENLAKHLADFASASTEYYEALETYLKYRLDLLSEKKENNLPEPNKPESHERDYQKVIRQLELSADDLLILDNHQFQTYVMDDWSWKHAFVGNTQMLAGYKSLPRS